MYQIIIDAAIWFTLISLIVLAAIATVQFPLNAFVYAVFVLAIARLLKDD